MAPNLHLNDEKFSMNCLRAIRENVKVKWCLSVSSIHPAIFAVNPVNPAEAGLRARFSGRRKRSIIGEVFPMYAKRAKPTNTQSFQLRLTTF